MEYRKQLWILYLSDIFLSISFYGPILILFLQSKGLSFQDIGFLSVAIYSTSFLLEYPTGIFADKYGRKLSLLISVFLSFISILIYILFAYLQHSHFFIRGIRIILLFLFRCKLYSSANSSIII